MRSTGQQPRTCGPGDRKCERIAVSVQPASSSIREHGEAGGVEFPGWQITLCVVGLCEVARRRRDPVATEFGGAKRIADDAAEGADHRIHRILEIE